VCFRFAGSFFSRETSLLISLEKRSPAFFFHREFWVENAFSFNVFGLLLYGVGSGIPLCFSYFPRDLLFFLELDLFFFRDLRIARRFAVEGFSRCFLEILTFIPFLKPFSPLR